MLQPEVLLGETQEETTHELARGLRPLLSSDSPLWLLLSEIEQRAKELAQSLQGDDLVTPEGIARAVKKQGVVEGLRLAISMVLDPVKELEDAERTDEPDSVP